MEPVTTLPRSRPLTYEDLATMPDDGHRYELIDGVLIVSPAPLTRHQRAVGNLYLLLRAETPAEYEVFLAPTDVVLARDTVLQPDLIVARRTDLTERNLPAAPVLAVEVASPSTMLIDLNLKKARLEAAGCAHYWVVDPASATIRAWDLLDGVYVSVGTASGEEQLQITQPWSMTIVPAELQR